METKQAKKIYFTNDKIKSKNHPIAPDPLSNINGKKNYLFDETDVWIALSEAVNKYLNDLEILILIKFHPNQNISYLKNNRSNSYKSVMISNNINLNSIIYYSDIIIGTYSSLLVEATF